MNKPLCLAGDFNNPAGQEGYQAILASPLGLQDAFEVAQEKSGSYTVPPEIDGWKGNTEPLRIDYVFTTKEFAVENLHVVFDGNKSPQVSDHYWLECYFKLEIITDTLRKSNSNYVNFALPYRCY